MIAPIVLSLDDVALCDVLKLVTSGALRPGRISPRGAVVYEPTAEGVAALSAWADDPEGKLLQLGAECEAGQCKHAAETESAEEEIGEHEERLGRLRDIVARLGNALAKARISETARAAMAELGEELF